MPRQPDDAPAAAADPDADPQLAEARAFEAQPAPAPPRRPWLGLAWPFWVSLGWIVLVIVASLAASLLPLPLPSQIDLTALSAMPSADHLLGTDALGRDMLSRMVYGARASLSVGVLTVIIGVVVGTGFGMMAGYFGGWYDRIITSLTDAVLSFPALVMLLGLVAVLEPGLTTLVIGLSLLTVPTFIRLARAQALRVSKEVYVVAARTTGARDRRIIMREVLPNVMPGILAYAFIIVAVVIVAEGSLSFLGLGVPPPTPSWGSMIAEGQQRLANEPQLTLIPSAVLFLTVYAFNIIGDRLRDRSDAREGAH